MTFHKTQQNWRNATFQKTKQSLFVWSLFPVVQQPCSTRWHFGAALSRRHVYLIGSFDRLLYRPPIKLIRMSDQSEHLQTWWWCQWKSGNHKSTVETRHSKLWSALEEMSEDHQSGRVRPAVTTNILFLLNEWHKELLSKTSPTREQPPERTRTQSAAEVKEYFIGEYVLITSPNEERTCLRLIQTETVLMMFTLNLSPVDK